MNKFNFLLKIKPKICLTVLVIALLVIPAHASASTVFETTGWIIGTQGLNFEFTADQPPYTYQATLADISQAPAFGFDFLFLSITTSTQILGSITGPGSFMFPVESGKTYFANVFGTGGGDVGAGLFGLEVTAVPIPGALWLLGSGLFGLACLRRRVR